MKFIKKPIVISLAVISIIAIAGGIFVFTRSSKPSYDFVVVKKTNVVQEVNVTGKVKPVDNVGLSFEGSGKVEKIYVDVNDKVKSGQALIKLDDSELLTQLEQTTANFENQEAKLRELEQGVKPEEIQVAETKMKNAEASLKDAKVSLENTKNKANIDLVNLYDDVENILRDAYAKADDAINKQTDLLFSNDLLDNPELTFSTSDYQAKIDVQWQRKISNNALKEFKEELAKLSFEYSLLDEVLQKTEDKLITIKIFLERLNDTLNSAVNIPESTVNAYKGYVNTGITNLNTTVSNITQQKQSIAAQKVANQQNIFTAESKVNDASSGLTLAENELSLKKSGPTKEQINAQEAQIKVARANVNNIKTQLAKTMLYSPIAGVITQQKIKIGEVVSPQNIVISIISESDFEIEANIPEADIAKVKINDVAETTLDAYGSDVVFKAVVVAIEPAETVIEGVATYKTTLQFLEKDARVKSGMTANINILTDKKEDAIAVPFRAVIAKNGEKVVRLLKSSGKSSREIMEERKVKIGLKGSDGNIEITEGITEGEKVIIFIKEK